MEACCCSCGNKFQKTAKGFNRRSLTSNVQLKNVERTIKEVIEKELEVTLTPDEKNKKFICPSCAWQITSMAKSTEMKSEAFSKLTTTLSKGGYLAKKVNIRSPYTTPRKIKKLRLTSPKKTVTKNAAQSDERSLPKTSKASATYSSKQIEIARACRFINRRQYLRAVKLLMNVRAGFKKAVQTYLTNIVRTEVIKMVNQKDSLFQGGKSLKKISQFDWTDRYNEVVKNCPTLSKLLEATLTTPQSAKYLALSSNTSISVKPCIGTLMSVMMYHRKPRHMTDFQEMNGLQMWLAGCNREMFARFNHLGLSLGIGATMTAIDRIRKSYDNRVLQWKTDVADQLLLPTETSTSKTIPYAEDTDSEKTIPMSLDMSGSSNSLMDIDNSPEIVEAQNDHSRQTQSESSVTKSKLGFSLTFDNVNQKLTVRHQTKDKQNKMLNMVQAYAAQDRIPTLHLNDDMPVPEEILNIPLEKYLPSEMDEVDLRAEMTVMVMRSISEYIPIFQTLQNEVTWHIQHQYSKESSKKSECVPIGVLDKDESRVAEMIDIMEEYQKYVPVKPDGQPLVIPLHADGLSCERGNDAQSARINGTTPWLQLQSMHMNIQEWHKRCLLLQDLFDELYSGSSCRDKGTLCHLKNYFNHRNVTTNVKEAFNFDEEFVQFCTDGYIVLCAMFLMNLDSIHDSPDDLPVLKKDKIDYMERIATQIMDIIFMSTIPIVQKILEVEEEGVELEDVYPFCVCKTEVAGAKMVYCDNKNCPRGVWFHLECLEMEEEDVPSGKWYCCDNCKSEKATKKNKRRKKVVENLIDGKRNYAVMLIWRGLNQRVRYDAIRENDGNRILLHWKFDMLQFFEKNHPKYFLVGHRLLSAVNGAVSKRLQHTLKWNRTVNPHGGKGKNIAMDLQMEFFNRAYKESVKDAGGKLTEATIARHSQMVGLGKTLKNIYEKSVSGLSRATGRSKIVPERQKDIEEFTELLKGENMFQIVLGRKHNAFPDIDNSLHVKIVPKNCRARLIRLRKENSKKRELVLKMQNE